jgi:hypothetical protein
MNYGSGYGNAINDKMRRKAGIASNATGGMPRGKGGAKGGGKGGAKGGGKKTSKKGGYR